MAAAAVAEAPGLSERAYDRGRSQFTQRIAGLTQTFTSQGIPANEANARAYSLMSRTISGQASMLAYVDIISIMAVVIICLAPLAFLMRLKFDLRQRD